jgi:beta-mannosidase
VVSDLRAEAHARLVLRVVDLDGQAAGARWSAERDVVVAARSSAVHFTAPRAEVLAGVDPARVVLVAELRDPRGGALGRNVLAFAKARDLALPDPELAIAVEARGEAAVVHVTARRFARAVWLSGGAEGGAFSDNFFDLLPGEKAAVSWLPPPGAGAAAAQRLGTALRAMSLRDAR